MEMPFKDAWEMVKKNIETQRREKLWQAWLAKYQHMDKDNFISFEEFVQKCEQPTVSKKSDAEIIDLAEAIAARDKRRKRER